MKDTIYFVARRSTKGQTSFIVAEYGQKLGKGWKEHRLKSGRSTRTLIRRNADERAADLQNRLS